MTASVLKQDLNTEKKEDKKNAIYYDKAQPANFSSYKTTLKNS